MATRVPQFDEVDPVRGRGGHLTVGTECPSDALIDTAVFPGMAHGPELVVLGVRGLGPDLRADDSEPMPSDAVFVHGMWPGDSGAGQMTRTVLIVESLIRPMCSGERPDRWVDGPSRRAARSRSARGHGGCPPERWFPPSRRSWQRPEWCSRWRGRPKSQPQGRISPDYR